nr:UDP glucuronosyltransferase [Brachionus paranguensis]
MKFFRNKRYGSVETRRTERVIFLWSVPANGHLNPTLCYANELLKALPEMNCSKLVFYSGKSFKDLILNLPNNRGKDLIEFRDYELEKNTGTENLLKLIMNFNTKPGTLFRVFQCYENSIKLGAKHLFQRLIQDMHNDRPVLILYDQALFFPKIACELYSKKYSCAKPLHVSYVTTFMCARGIYPYWSDLEKMGLLGNNLSKRNKIRTFFILGNDFFHYLFTYYKTLWWDLHFSFLDLVLRCELPLSQVQMIDQNMNLVFVMPEVQPRLEYFQNKANIKFVGPSVDEVVRSNISQKKTDMDQYVERIEEFLAANLVNSLGGVKSTFMRSESTGENFKKYHKPIIYVSMGTVFNNENSNLFRILIEGCKKFSDTYAIIISTGDEKTYQKYAGQYTNDNILLIPHTPQVEILKRTHLFITHAGMNSVSEAMNYGVPIICLPLSGDQPFVAWRVADELGMGIRLQPDESLTVEKVISSITKILNDPSYRLKAQSLSKLSQNYAGHKTAVEYTIKALRDHESKMLI